jgi:hypothetical protein
MKLSWWDGSIPTSLKDFSGPHTKGMSEKCGLHTDSPSLTINSERRPSQSIPIATRRGRNHRATSIMARDTSTNWLMEVLDLPILKDRCTFSSKDMRDPYREPHLFLNSNFSAPLTQRIRLFRWTCRPRLNAGVTLLTWWDLSGFPSPSRMPTAALKLKTITFSKALETS